jgi:Fasciclin domain
VLSAPSFCAPDADQTMAGAFRKFLTWLHLVTAIATRQFVIEGGAKARSLQSFLDRHESGVLELRSIPRRALLFSRSATTKNTDKHRGIVLFEQLGEKKPHRHLKGMKSDKDGKDKVMGRRVDDDYFYSKEKKGKGKGKGKGKKGESKKGKSKKGLPSVCKDLDFGGGDSITFDDEVFGKGKGYRQLQFDGELCEPNVLDHAKNIIDLSIFVSLVDAAGLNAIFWCAGPFTALPPSNAAFAANPSVTNYLANPDHVDELRQVLLYHILPGLTLHNDWKAGPTETLQGDAIEVTLDPVLFNNKAEIVEADIGACNGALNIIDEILLPPGTLFFCAHRGPSIRTIQRARTHTDIHNSFRLCFCRL